jgi:hypothetical protein
MDKIMDKLTELVSKCKASVSININGHKDVYQTVEQYIQDMDENAISYIKIHPDVLKEMIKRDTVIEVYFYPNSPVSFHLVYHYDVDLALDKALELLKK